MAWMIEGGSECSVYPFKRRIGNFQQLLSEILTGEKADNGTGAFSSPMATSSFGDVPIAVELRRVDVAGVNVTRPS